mmetsp:Transcript_9828/g.27498  ORF Transcript_9828/g.27498 Transcript_9828/m.27498 type:complete len:290 (-) Transcript_9828:247-1116(-)
MQGLAHCQPLPDAARPERRRQRLGERRADQSARGRTHGEAHGVEEAGDRSAQIGRCFLAGGGSGGTAAVAFDLPAAGPEAGLPLVPHRPADAAQRPEQARQTRGLGVLHGEQREVHHGPWRLAEPCGESDELHPDQRPRGGARVSGTDVGGHCVQGPFRLLESTRPHRHERPELLAAARWPGAAEKVRAEVAGVHGVGEEGARLRPLPVRVVRWTLEVRFLVRGNSAAVLAVRDVQQAVPHPGPRVDRCAGGAGEGRADPQGPTGPVDACRRGPERQRQGQEQGQGQGG